MAGMRRAGAVLGAGAMLVAGPTKLQAPTQLATRVARPSMAFTAHRIVASPVMRFSRTTVCAPRSPVSRSCAPTLTLRRMSGAGSDGSVGIDLTSVGPVLLSAGALGATNLLGLGISLATGSHAHLDLIGSGSFAVVAWLTSGVDLRSKLSGGIISLWAVRLALFLFYRALQVGHDLRLDETLATTGGAVGFWAVSFLWGFITALPHTLGASCSKRPELGPLALAALLLSATGLYWEWVADAQKWWFKADLANRGNFCDVGLWSLSQHPNYFGNLLIWIGVFLMNAAPLWATNKGYFLLSCTSPLFLGALFYGQASGAFMNSAALAAAKYGGNVAFEEYVKNVPLIVPAFFFGGF